MDSNEYKLKWKNDMYEKYVYLDSSLKKQKVTTIMSLYYWILAKTQKYAFDPTFENMNQCVDALKNVFETKLLIQPFLYICDYLENSESKKIIQSKEFLEILESFIPSKVLTKEQALKVADLFYFKKEAFKEILNQAIFKDVKVPDFITELVNKGILYPDGVRVSKSLEELIDYLRANNITFDKNYIHESFLKNDYTPYTINSIATYIRNSYSK